MRLISYFLNMTKKIDKLCTGRYTIPIKLFFRHDERGLKMKLGEVALVRSGLVLSRKAAKSPSPFRYSLLSLRAMSGEGEILEEELDVFHAAELLKDCLLYTSPSPRDCS